MTDIIQFKTADGLEVLVESAGPVTGPPVPIVDRGRTMAVAASTTLDEALSATLPALRRVVAAIGELTPDERELEFGIKLDAQAGALIAKTGVSGHLTVRLRWNDAGGRAGDDPAGEAPVGGG